MGDNNSGGGGSVQWEVDMKRVKRHSSDTTGTRMVVSGADNDGNEGDYFTVTIQLAGQTIEDFKAGIQGVGGKAVFKLQIRDDPKQINVHWPD